ncbi:MAG: hypothetical protein QOE70_4656 [Chthoniobacter sp.]|nr:hypothetical protein [Chthoniobacter sp.]
MLAQEFLDTVGQAALLLGAVLVLIAAGKRWLLGMPPWDAHFALWAALATLVAAGLVTLARHRSLPQAAAAIDRLGQTRDRFVTALAFSREEPSPELCALAIRECASFIRGADFARLVRLRPPRELLYLVIPALALLLLDWEARRTFGARDAAAAAGLAEIEGTAKKLEELARQAEKTNELAKMDELEKIAEELKRSAQQLRADATTPAEAEKAALRELSELEKLVQELQKQPGAPSPAELRELAKALEKSEATKDAAAAMEAGDLTRAAEQLEKAMQDLAQQGDERTQEQIEQALKDALEQLAQQKQLSEALQKLAQQQPQQPGQKGEAGQLSKELAEMLKKLKPQAGQQNQQGKPQDSQALKNLLAALQNLKFGEGEPKSAGNQPPQGPPTSLSLTQSSGPNQIPGSAGDPRQPSGQPGSEHDTGTTDSPFGKNQDPAGRDAQANSLTGRLGDGETLQQFLPSAGDSSKAKRRYKELYQAMAPAAEDAMVQENIPLGSRFFIKRYFESIRPRE